MIRADSLAGANLENENPGVLLQSALRFFKSLPGEERQKFVHHVTEKASRIGSDRSSLACGLIRALRTDPQGSSTSRWLEMPIVWHNVQS